MAWFTSGVSMPAGMPMTVTLSVMERVAPG